MAAIEFKTNEDTLEHLLQTHAQNLKDLQSRLDAHPNKARFQELLEREDTELIMLRFLVGKAGQVDVAWEAFEKSMRWRDENKSNEIPDLDDPTFDEKIPYNKEMQATVPELRFTGVAKDGSPLAFELKGRIDVYGFIKALTPDQYCQHLTWVMVATYRKINKLSREAGKLLMTCVVVCLKNVGAQHLKYIPYFKYEVDMAQENLIELMGVAIVVNTPWFFNIIWQIVKPWLDKRTLTKVNIITSGNSEKDLHQYIDPKYIPTALGGEDPTPQMVIPDPTKGMTQLTLAAGKQETFEAQASKGNMSINWRFKIGSKDIGFEVVFVDEDGGEDKIVEYGRVSADGEIKDGSYVSCRPGKLKITLDNSYSYWTSKQVLYFLGEFEDIPQ